ncbi:MAG: hypothetical protein HY602_01570 [Parcubacteria group bacterium]|nr:hypothetical protein [Parcubacteria group bacterium]
MKRMILFVCFFVIGCTTAENGAKDTAPQTPVLVQKRPILPEMESEPELKPVPPSVSVLKKYSEMNQYEKQSFLLVSSPQDIYALLDEADKVQRGDITPDVEACSAPGCQAALAKYYMAKGKTDSARYYALEALTKFKLQPKVKEFIFEALMADNNNAMVKELFQNQVEVVPKLISAKIQAAETHYNSYQYEKCVNAAQEALALISANTHLAAKGVDIKKQEHEAKERLMDGYIKLAEVEANQGKWESSIQNYKKAMEVNGNTRPAKTGYVSSSSFYIGSMIRAKQFEKAPAQIEAFVAFLQRHKSEQLMDEQGVLDLKKNLVEGWYAHCESLANEGKKSQARLQIESLRKLCSGEYPYDASNLPVACLKGLPKAGEILGKLTALSQKVAQSPE